MKKIIVSIFTCIVICGLVLLSACTSDEVFAQKEASYSVAEVQSIRVDVTDRNVEIVPSDDNEIHISYFENEKERLSMQTDGGILTANLVVEQTGIIATKPSVEYRKIYISIPENALRDLKIVTTNGAISVNTVTVTGSVELSSNGGDISLKNINVGEAISLTAKNGDISGSITGGWDMYSIHCTIKKGDCNLPLEKSDGEKTLTVNCNNGNVNIELIK